MIPCPGSPIWYPGKIPPDKNLPGKNPPEKISLNAVERDPVETRVLNPNASEASYKPEQRRRGSVPPGGETSGGEYRGGNFRGGKALAPFGTPLFVSAIMCAYDATKAVTCLALLDTR